MMLINEWNSNNNKRNNNLKFNKKIEKKKN